MNSLLHPDSDFWDLDELLESDAKFQIVIDGNVKEISLDNLIAAIKHSILQDESRRGLYY